MPKTTVKTDFRVVVYPRDKGDFGSLRTNAFGSHSPAEEERICKEIARQIEMHVSRFDYDRGEIRVTYDTTPVCSHCGDKWTEDSATYNGGCCDADEANAPAAAEAPSP